MAQKSNSKSKEAQELELYKQLFALQQNPKV
jgi:hypothetical protein